MMKAQAFAGLSRELRAVSPRRCVLRLFGRVTALGVVAMVGQEQAEAKRECGGKGKKRCILEARCVKGKCVPKQRFSTGTCTVEGVDVPTSTPCPSGGICCAPSGVFPPVTSECIDSQSDARHCGGCFRPCAAGESCREGRCVSAA